MQDEDLIPAGAPLSTRRKLMRQALLRSAQALMEAGQAPTVPEVADHAGISRATAYRYFSTPEKLMSEAALDRIAASLSEMRTEATSPEAAAEQVVLLIMGMVRDNEPAFRAMLRMWMEPGGAERGSRRMVWIRAALTPFEAELPPGALDRLVPALSLLAGIEPLVVLDDVCGLDRAAADEVLGWTARAIVRAALAA